MLSQTAASGGPVARPVDQQNDSIPSDSIVYADTDSIDGLYTYLDDLVVTAVKAAVVAKEDTLEFNAGSFKTRANAVVEDLLKKLPGVEVGSDGSITSGGKSIKKILIDGKEFFGDDPTMASKNIPAEMVDKVQVVDRKSDLARLTGIDDGEEETVINLTVKKSMMSGWFGTVGAGYGTDGRYEGSFGVSSFTDNNQISIVGGGNNINDLGFSDSGRGRFRSFGPQGGITSSQRIGLNFNVGKSEKFRVGGNVFYTHSSTRTESFTHNQYLFPDSVSNKTEGSLSRDKGHNLRADFRMRWNIDDWNTLEFRPAFSFNKRDSELNDTSFLRAGDAAATMVNSTEKRQFNDGVGLSASGQLIFNHNFASHPGRSFSVELKYDYSDTRQHTTTWNDLLYYLENDRSETLYQYLDNREWQNGVSTRLTWSEPLGDVTRGNFIQVAYRFSGQFSNGNRDTYDIPLPEAAAMGALGLDASQLGGYQDVIAYDAVPEGALFNTDLSNRFRNTFLSHQLQIGYKKITKKYNLEAGMMLAPSTRSSRDLINADRTIPSSTVWNVSPFARLRFKFSGQSSLRVNYRASSSSPTLAQLQPVADISDPTHIVVGNPDLKPAFTQSLRANFNRFDTERQQALQAMLNASYATNVVVSRTVSDRNTGVRTTTYANANGNFSAMGMVMLSQPFSNRKFRYSVSAMASYSSAAGYINEDFNRSGNLRLAPDFGVTFSCDLLQVSLRPTYVFTMATNTLPGQINRYTHAYGTRGDLSLDLPFGLRLYTDIDWRKTTGLSAGFNTSQCLWNAQLSYSFLADKSLTLSARVYDLLGQKRNVSRSISAAMISDNSYNDLTRYVMFGLTWTFNTMKNKKGAEAGFGEERPGRGMMRDHGERMRGEGRGGSRGPGGPGGGSDRF